MSFEKLYTALKENDVANEYKTKYLAIMEKLSLQ